MIQAESISSAAKMDYTAIEKGEKNPLGEFLQVWMEAYEGNESPASLNLPTVQDKIENLNAENLLIPTISPEGGRLPLQDEGEKKGTEEMPSVIGAPPVPDMREEINHASLHASLGTGLIPMVLSPGADVEALQPPVEMIRDINWEERGRLTVQDVEASALERPARETIADSAVTRNIAEHVEPNSEQLRQRGPNRTLLLDPEEKVGVTVQDMEASALERPARETVADSAVTPGIEERVDMNGERFRQRGPNQTLLFDPDGKGEGAIRSLSSSGSGVADFEGKGYEQFQGEEGDEIASALLDRPLSEEAPAMIQRDAETIFDRSVQDQTRVAENRLSHSLSDEKLLLRQVAEKIHLWRPHEGDTIRFQLEPKALGMLQVDISIHENGIVADIVTKHHFVKTLLEQNQELLRETLAGHGLRVDQFSVNVGTPDRHNSNPQHDLLGLGAPRSFSVDDERVSYFEAIKRSEPGDYTINLYV
ncbi:MAG: flagellar hook-length control protein FliK [Nitrospiria bacterium]